MTTLIELIPDDTTRGRFARGVRWTRNLQRTNPDQARLYCEHGRYVGAVAGAILSRCEFCASGLSAELVSP